MNWKNKLQRHAILSEKNKPFQYSRNKSKSSWGILGLSRISTLPLIFPIASLCLPLPVGALTIMEIFNLEETVCCLLPSYIVLWCVPFYPQISWRWRERSISFLLFSFPTNTHILIKAPQTWQHLHRATCFCLCDTNKFFSEVTLELLRCFWRYKGSLIWFPLERSCLPW